MKYEEYLGKVENSEEFKGWIADNAHYYLVHFFTMTNQVPQFGYYSEEHDKIVTFQIDEEKIIRNEAEESFKKEGAIPKLVSDDVAIDIDEAFQIANDFQKETYPGEIIDRHMILLQAIDEVATYNITLISKAFNFINIRINAKDKTVISHKKQSILNLGKDPKEL